MVDNSKKAAVVCVAVGVAIGVAFVFAVKKFNAVTSSPEFCGASCHSMQAYVADQPEFKNSVHQTNSSGLHAHCADCHLPSGFFRETWAHITSGSRDLYATLTNDFTDPQVWAVRRDALAHGVRDKMLADDSENCRACHAPGQLNPLRERGQRQHYLAEKQGVTCIGCHYDLVHLAVPRRESFISATTLRDDH